MDRLEGSRLLMGSSMAREESCQFSIVAEGMDDFFCSTRFRYKGLKRGGSWKFFFLRLLYTIFKAVRGLGMLSMLLWYWVNENFRLIDAVLWWDKSNFNGTRFIFCFLSFLWINHRDFVIHYTRNNSWILNHIKLFNSTNDYLINRYIIK